MSLENTLREMMNEMKMPPYKEPLDPTVHSGPEEKPLPPGVHTGPQKPPVPSHTGSQKPKPKPSEITRTPGKPKPKTLTEPHMNEGRITDKIRTAAGRISSAIDAQADKYVPYVQTDGRGRKTGLNPRDTDTLFGHHISPRAAAAAALGAALAVGTARDRVGGQFDLHKAEQEGQRASASAESAYKALQNVARSAQQVPELAPGAEAAKKSKPRRRLEETLKDHYKQRLQEGLLGNIGKAVSQMDLSPGSLARAAGRTASRIGNLVRGRGFKTGEDIAYEQEEARAEAQRQITPDAPKTPGRSGFVASAKEQKRLQKQLRDERENDERRENISRRMLKDPRTDEISAWGGA